ncbi:MAG: PqqD family protein, partial [Chloracidobacterium sp.]|uniref:PqqD family protein n=1 Tax=Chloracidobacterium validum TaxID=2821543 RepID=A0ABX8BD47_9BACT|nr:PqqD family protein [Chloracidobacterium validum]QUW04352.1 PqqD family protein [Chloracidobacterium validum]
MTLSIPLGQVVEQLPCVMRRVAGETLLIPIRGQAADLDAIYVLNETAAFLWSQLERSGNPTTLGSALMQAFDVAPQQAVEDVTLFLRDLQQAGLVRLTVAASNAA